MTEKELDSALGRDADCTLAGYKRVTANCEHKPHCFAEIVGTMMGGLDMAFAAASSLPAGDGIFDAAKYAIRAAQAILWSRAPQPVRERITREAEEINARAVDLPDRDLEVH